MVKYIVSKTVKASFFVTAKIKNIFWAWYIIRRKNPSPIILIIATILVIGLDLSSSLVFSLRKKSLGADLFFGQRLKIPPGRLSGDIKGARQEFVGHLSPT
jgi:hypothetical protein